MAKYRLKTRAVMRGEVRDPGYVFELKEGELGPHRTVVASNHGAQVSDHDVRNDLKDVPLYEEVTEEATEEVTESIKPFNFPKSGE